MAKDFDLLISEATKVKEDLIENMVEDTYNEYSKLRYEASEKRKGRI